MNGRKHIVSLILIVLAVLLLTLQPVQAQTNRVSFTGTETSVADISPGVESFPGGKLYHVRGAVSSFAFSATDPRVCGENLVTINWNFRFVDEPVFVTGPMWGTFVLTTSGGAWEGTWTGRRDENGYSYFHFTGAGTGGYAGMSIHFTSERLDPDPTQPESVSGFIVETGG